MNGRPELGRSNARSLGVGRLGGQALLSLILRIRLTLWVAHVYEFLIVRIVKSMFKDSILISAASLITMLSRGFADVNYNPFSQSPSSRLTLVFSYWVSKVRTIIYSVNFKPWYS